MSIQAALLLAEEYGLPVFPCGPDKQPRTTRGFKDASRNIEQIAEWWGRWPDALIGVPTGRESGILIVDVDPDGAEWHLENADRLSCARIHKTKRGHHLLFKMPAAEVRNSTGKLAPGVDVRAEGGYGIWWAAHGFEATGDLLEITEPPQWLLDRLIDKPPQRAAANGHDIPAGSRNSTLASMAGRLRRAGAEALEIEAALFAFNSRCVPPLPDAEVQQIAASVARYAPAASSEQLPTEAFPADTVENITSSRSPQVVQDLFYGFTVLAAGPNIGKSALEVDMFAHIAAGLPFFGRKVNGGPVLIVAAEAGYSIVQRARATIREKFAGKRLPLYVCREIPRLGDERQATIDAARIIATIRAIESAEGEPLRAFAIDTVAAVLGGADENGEGMQRLVQMVLAIIQQTGAAALLLHHPAKADPDGLRGHSSLAGAVDCIIVASDQGSGVRRATVRKSRDGATGGEIHFRLEPVIQPDRDQFGDPLTTVIVRAAEAPAIKVSVRGKNQHAAMAAITEWARTHDTQILSSAEMAGMAKSLGLNRGRRMEVVNALVNVGVLSPAVGGHLVNRELLT